MSWRRAVKAMFSAAGLHLQRKSEDPQHTLMGLKTLPIRSVVDIGANEGQFGRFIVKHFPAADLYCFEPLPQPCAVLKHWALTRSGTHVFNVGLGETSGTAEMYIHTDHTPSSSLLRTTRLSAELYPMTGKQQKVTVNIRKLDDVFLEQAALPAEDILVKIDVQGFETSVIHGGRSFLARARACIVEVCLDALYEGQGAYREVFQEFDRLGYRYAGNLSQVYAKDGHVIYIDAVFIR